MFVRLRHAQPGLGRAMPRKPVPRGASRPVVREPLSTRLPKPSLTGLKRLTWPLALVLLLVGCWEFGSQLLPYANRPIARVSVQSELAYVNPKSVQKRLAPYVEQQFFAVDLVGIRQELESIPWISRAEVRRVWPDQIMIRIEEQLPIARWGDEALLNNAGEAFEPTDLAHYEHLPLLHGPKRAQQRVMQQYQLLSQMLRPLGFSIVRLELRERGSWFLTTSQGIELLLGRDHVIEKIRRFITIYQHSLKAQNENIARIDLRHANGLAVAWREPVPVAAEAPASGKN